ncbi:MAG: hypothetical protein JW787_12815, partial [Sedimentisphaerales bacterium]|nr:hypothetical protein [Sedimentisphaerales bacterium]
ILILWTGPKHSGKTTRALDLVNSARKEGFRIAGLLAPSIYNDGILNGFYAYDLVSALKKPLAKRNNDIQGKRHFTFLSEGLKIGLKALSKNSIENADLIIVDEFGPSELSGRIWRKSVDSMLSYGNIITLLVVRQELVEDIIKLYSHIPYEQIAANETGSIAKVINILKYHKAK